MDDPGGENKEKLLTVDDLEPSAVALLLAVAEASGAGTTEAAGAAQSTTTSAMGQTTIETPAVPSHATLPPIADGIVVEMQPLTIAGTSSQPNGTTAEKTGTLASTTRTATAVEGKDVAAAKKLSYFQLYRYATPSSYALMAVATIAAMANGCVIPLMNLIISTMASVVTDWAANPANYPGDALFQALVINLIKLAALGLTALIAGFLQTYAWMVSAENQTRKIRETYFAAIIRQEMGYFDQNPTGEIATRIASDINIMYDGMAEKVGNVGFVVPWRSTMAHGESLSIFGTNPQIIQFGTSFVVGMILAFVTGWRLALVMFAAFPLPSEFSPLFAFSLADFTYQNLLSSQPSRCVKCGDESTIRSRSSNRAIRKPAQRPLSLSNSPLPSWPTTANPSNSKPTTSSWKTPTMWPRKSP